MKFEKYEIIPINVSIEMINDTLKVVKNKNILGEDENTYAKLSETNFSNGEINLQVKSKLLDEAPEYARGFIGLAFRIDNLDNNFECIYIRPTNGRSNNQLRRNRSVQYFSYPNFKYYNSRETNPGEYESYADMGLNEWIDIRISVKDNKAKLYLNNSIHPNLIVNDLKHGKSKGNIGLFVDIGTEGYFKNITIKNES